MYTREFAGNATNKVLVDRQLGRAYEIVKDVYNQLELIKKYAESYTELEKYNSTLKTLNTSLAEYSVENTTGVFIGHDQGRVGVEPDKLTFTGENWISALTRNWDSLTGLYKNLETVQQVSSGVNAIKAVAYKLADITTAATMKDTVKDLADNTQLFSDLHKYLDNIKVVATNIKSVETSANNLDVLKTSVDNLEVFTHVHEYLHCFKSLSDNLSIYNAANLNLKTYMEILEFRSDITKLANSLETIKDLVSKIAIAEDRIPILNEVISLTDSMQQIIDSKELMSNAIKSLPVYTSVLDNLDLVRNLSVNIDKVSAVHDKLDLMQEVNSRAVELNAKIEATNPAIAEVTTQIQSMNGRLNETSVEIAEFNAHKPELAILTKSKVRKIEVLGNISVPDSGEHDIPFLAPADGWFTGFWKGTGADNGNATEAYCNCAISLGAEGLDFDYTATSTPTLIGGGVCIYVEKGTKLTMTLKGFSSAYGKIQFVYSKESD